MSRQYTVYDNAAGGFTIKYRYFLYKEKKYVSKVFQADNINAMKNFERKLLQDGYKFVGRF